MRRYDFPTNNSPLKLVDNDDNLNNIDFNNDGLKNSVFHRFFFLR